MDGTSVEGESAEGAGLAEKDRRNRALWADRVDQHGPVDEAAPLSWPLVERRRSPQLTADRRRSTDAETEMSARIAGAPLMPFRIAALFIAIALGVDQHSWSDATLLTSAAVLTLYTGFATLRPVPYTNARTARRRTLVELAIITAVVVASGSWRSPFALTLVPTAMLASFVGGIRFAGRLVSIAAAIITVQHFREMGFRPGVPGALLWVALLAFVTVTSGLSRRSAEESARRQQAALDRVGSLAEANGLLFSLQRVAQTLPASLNLNDVLDSTVTRVQSLIDHSMLTVLLQTDTPGRLEPARVTGYAEIGPLGETELPAVLRDALRAPKTVRRDELAAADRGLAPMAESGLYAALRARGSVIGLIAVESLEPHHFGQQQAEILHGLAEPFGIAIDNARLFQRLRITSADEERTRIARDLHDHIGSSLAYLGFEIDRSIAAATRNEAVDATLKELRLQVTQMVGEVRETLYDLRSDVSESQDLAATLRQFVDRVRGRSGLDITFVCDQRVRLSIAHERELWHIAREALINVERHAQATKASMEWTSTASHASLTIRDNGVGMLFGSGRVDSYGMRGMRERAGAIGAQMTTESSPTGTVIQVGLQQPKEASTWD